VGCQNYDDQFDSLESQINALASTVAGLSQVQSDLASLAGTVSTLASTVNGLGDTIDTAVADGLTDIQSDIDAIEAAVADVASSEEVSALQDAVDASQEDLDELLANSAVFQGNVIVNNAATLETFHAMKSSLAIVNGYVDIDAKAEMDATKLQELVDAIQVTTKQFDYQAESSAVAAVTFNNLSGTQTLTIKQAGDYLFQSLSSATVINLDNSFKSKVTKIDFRELTSVTKFQTSGTDNTIDFNKAMELHLTKLVYYAPLDLTIVTDEGAAMPFAIDDIDADGDQKDIDLDITGPASLTISNLADGTLAFAKVKDLVVNGFGGTVTVGAGVETFSSDSFVTGSTLTATDLETLNITGALDADTSTDKSGPVISLSSKASLETVTIAGKVASVSLQGNGNLTDVTITATVDGAVNIGGTTGNSDLTSVTLTGSTIAGLVTVSNNDDLESLTIDTTFAAATASGSSLDGKITVSENDAMTSLTISSDKIEELTITGNDELATIDLSGITAAGATGSPEVYIYDNNLVATSGTNTEDATATTAALGAVGKAGDLGSFDDGTSGMSSAKAYLTVVAADADSKADVRFDSVETFDDEETAAADESSDVTSTSTSAVASVMVLKLTPNTADTGDDATYAKRSFVITSGSSFEAYANNADIVGTAVTLDSNNSVAISTQILTTAATTAATAAGVTMTATDGGNPVAYVAIGPNSSAAENSATGAVKSTFASTVSDTMTITVEGRSLTYTGVAHTGTVAYANAIVASWAAKYTTAATERYTITTADGTSSLAGESFVLIKFTAKDRGTGSLNKSVSATFSAGKNQTDSNVGIMIGNDASFTKSTSDNVTKGDDIVLTFAASTAGSILSEIGYFGKTQADAAKNISLVAGTYAELSSTYFANNESASNVSRANINLYPAESRRNDVVMPEALNAAATSNAVSFTRVHWL